MKYFLLLLFFLVLGGVIFYFGWIQVTIPEHSRGVFFSRITGYDDNIIKAGEFNWKWQRLIPLTSNITVFTIKPHSATIKVSGSLPSGEVYSRILIDDPDFEYMLEIYLELIVNSDDLVELVKEHNLEPDNFEEWYGRQVQHITQKIKPEIHKVLKSESPQDALEELFGPERATINKIAAEDLSVVITTATLIDYKLPDRELYVEAKELYFSDIKSRQKALQDLYPQQSKVEMQLRYLEDYGEVFSEHPELIDFLSLLGADKIISDGAFLDFMQQDNSE